ncbi:MAG: AmmeMemoRadiSam system protein B [Chloroflexi bacterium]|nr:AmmeMemoRadiSam system protein B [Chloroflexota bacterium]
MLGSILPQSSKMGANVRRAAVAGAFYPASPAVLHQSVQNYLERARVPDFASPARAVIAPHAGYLYSGPIAGHSFRTLDLDLQQPQTIILIGPAHYVPVDGVAVGDFDAFETPLGMVPVDRRLLAVLQKANPRFISQQAAHVPEHSLEVQIPFLQVRKTDQLSLAPLLTGHSRAESIAATLLPSIRNDSTLRLVISSDLSHFHPYEKARSFDTDLVRAILRGDLDAVQRGEACGRIPILVLMHLALQLDWQPHLLDYRNSGDTAGDKRRVVGYAAIAYTE